MVSALYPPFSAASMAATDGNAFRGKYHEELQKTAKAIASAGKGKVSDATTTKLCIREAFACEGQ